MGSKLDNGIFTQSELIVGVGVVLVVGSLGWVKTNFHGLLFNFSVIFFGYLLLAVSVVSLDWLDLQALGFMIMTGLSSYFGCK